ncbi:MULTISPECIES: FecR family protein [Niastella]|uniref:FecR family protein n=1 Tax=Niastella soli TaxID=2821487 RepID=A0ABS3Z2C4_9BACT|nr:FecR domain-containing protein [Niastella soli]MBO9204178.1 FecR family protein [Niastella soli]
MEKYSTYQTEDFLRDDSFINWVLDPEGENNQEWTKWMNSSAAKKEAARKAVDIIRTFDFKKETVSAEFYNNLKQRIDNTIAREQAIPLQPKRFTGGWMKAAAVITALLIGGLVLYYVRKPAYTYISTPYAAIKTVWLPDSSEVVLNANSSIRFNRKRTNGKREVWLTGEAFFKVRHIDKAGTAQPFAVYASDAVIEVLGTEFNVKAINNTTGVLLQQGKVRFSIPASNATTIMQPNEYCQFSTGQGKISTRVANPVLFTSWLDHKYRFEKATVQNVCETLKEYFGFDFIIERPVLKTQVISGTLELQNLETTLFVLHELLHTTIVATNKQVVIK